MQCVHKTAPFLLGCAVAVLSGLTQPAAAQELTPSELDAADAQGYLGEWTLSMTLLGNATEISLQLLDIDGKVAGLLVTEYEPEPSIIEKISRTPPPNNIRKPRSSGSSNNRPHISRVLNPV